MKNLYAIALMLFLTVITMVACNQECTEEFRPDGDFYWPYAERDAETEEYVPEWDLSEEPWSRPESDYEYDLPKTDNTDGDQEIELTDNDLDEAEIDVTPDGDSDLTDLDEQDSVEFIEQEETDGEPPLERLLPYDGRLALEMGPNGYWQYFVQKVGGDRKAQAMMYTSDSAEDKLFKTLRFTHDAADLTSNPPQRVSTVLVGEEKTTAWTGFIPINADGRVSGENLFILRREKQEGNSVSIDYFQVNAPVPTDGELKAVVLPSNQPDATNYQVQVFVISVRTQSSVGFLVTQLIRVSMDQGSVVVTPSTLANERQLGQIYKPEAPVSATIYGNQIWVAAANEFNRYSLAGKWQQTNILLLDVDKVSRSDLLDFAISTDGKMSVLIRVEYSDETMPAEVLWSLHASSSPSIPYALHHLQVDKHFQTAVLDGNEDYAVAYLPEPSQGDDFYVLELIGSGLELKQTRQKVWGRLLWLSGPDRLLLVEPTSLDDFASYTLRVSTRLMSEVLAGLQNVPSSP